jgi:hypothetical protein
MAFQGKPLSQGSIPYGLIKFLGDGHEGLNVPHVEKRAQDSFKARVAVLELMYCTDYDKIHFKPPPAVLAGRRF